MTLLRRTVSTESPKAFPTTGIAVPATVFIPFIVMPSILLVNVPSSESTPTNIVIIKPIHQIALLSLLKIVILVVLLSLLQLVLLH